MTRTEQRRFVRDLVRNVERDLLENVSRVPKEWDGHELRQLIADRFVLVSWTLKEKGNRGRYRRYRNEVRCRDLLS